MEIQRLGKYEIRGTLGKGAMGIVYEAWDPIISRKVAIKTVRMPDASEIEAQEELARFKREAQAAGRLTHPNIVGIFDYGETEHLAYIVMEFVEGRTLKAIVDSSERMPVATIARVMADILAGLQYSHERGVIHRDIKPANIMLTKEGQAKIADFGIARIESSNLTQAGTIMGTPAYMSPEQFMGQTVDATTDIYSSGVLLFQLLTGERPFEGSMATIMHKVLNTAPPKPSELSVTAPRGLDDVVAQAMAKRPEDRFPTAAAFAQALRDGLAAPSVPRPPRSAEPDATIVASATAKPTVSAPSPTPPAGEAAAAPRPAVPAPPKRKSRTPMVAAGVVLVAALGGGGAWYALSGPGSRPSVANAEPVITPPTTSPTSPPSPTQVTQVQPPTPPSRPALPKAPVPAAPTPPSTTLQVQNTQPAQPAIPPPQPQVTQVVPPAVQPTTPPPNPTSPATAPNVPRTTPGAAQTQPTTIVPPSATRPSAPIVAEPVRPLPATPNSRLPPPTVAETPQPPAALASSAAPPVAPLAQPAPPTATTAAPPVAVVTATPFSPPPATVPPASIPPASVPPASVAPASVPSVTPASRPVVTAMAGLTPEALRRAIGSAVAGADCAIVTGDVSAPSGQVELRGVVGRGQPQQTLQAAVRGAAPAAAVDWGLGVLEGPYCPALNLIRAHVPAFGTGQPGVQIALKGDQTNLSEADKVEIRARAPNFPSYLEIDYFSNDGTVAHLVKAATGTPPVQPGVTREVGGFEVAPPYGTDLIIAIASSAPLFTKDQPLAEDAAAYLRELRTALDNVTRRNARIAAGVLMLRTSPKS